MMHHADGENDVESFFVERKTLAGIGFVVNPGIALARLVDTSL